MEFECNNIPSQYCTILRYVMDHGDIVSPRGLETHEVRGLGLDSQDPSRRFFAHPHRKANPVFPIVEVMWHLSGSNDPEPIAYYIRNVRKYVNPLTGTFDGAYGPRLRSYSGKIDQIKALRERLVHDLSSRRAVLSLYDPLLDFNDRSLDIPCYALVQFLVRNNKLELYAYARSQDMIRGFVYDTAEWQLLQDIVAGWLGVGLGHFRVFIASAHIYSSDLPIAKRVVEQDTDFDLYRAERVERASCSYKEFLSISRLYRGFEPRLRKSNKRSVGDFIEKQLDHAITGLKSDFWRDAFRAIAAFGAIKEGNLNSAHRIMSGIGNELKPALAIWLKNQNEQILSKNL